MNSALTLPFKLRVRTNSIFHVLPLASPVNAREASGAACAFLHDRERESGEVAEIADISGGRGACRVIQDAHAARPALLPLADIPAGAVACARERAVEPNGYYLPEWALAVNASARGRIGASALAAWSDASSVHDGPARMIGLLPVDIAVASLSDSPSGAGQVRSPMARFARRRSIAMSPRTPRSD